jgi:hypothetical protein
MEVALLSGIANRIQSLASMMAAAEAARRPLSVCWPYQKGVCSVKAADIFDINRFPSWVTIKDTCPSGWEAWKQYNKNKEEPIPSGPFQWQLRGSAQPYKKNSKVVFEQMRKLPYSNKLKKTIETLFKGKHVIGVHIRRGDKPYLEKTAPLEAYIKALKKAPRELSFFVCSDDAAAVEAIRAEFGNDRVLTIAKALDRDTPQGGKDAALDFLGLSMTLGIIGSLNTSFSWAASIVGSIPMYRISVPTPNT